MTAAIGDGANDVSMIQEGKKSLKQSNLDKLRFYRLNANSSAHRARNIWKRRQKCREGIGLCFHQVQIRAQDPSCSWILLLHPSRDHGSLLFQQEPDQHHLPVLFCIFKWFLRNSKSSERLPNSFEIFKCHNPGHSLVIFLEFVRSNYHVILQRAVHSGADSNLWYIGAKISDDSASQ